MYAVNGAGDGVRTNVTHCLDLRPPTITCGNVINATAVSVNMSTNYSSYPNEYVYNLRMTYVDVDGKPVSKRIQLELGITNYVATGT